MRLPHIQNITALQGSVDTKCIGIFSVGQMLGCWGSIGRESLAIHNLDLGGNPMSHD